MNAISSGSVAPSLASKTFEPGVEQAEVAGSGKAGRLLSKEEKERVRSAIEAAESVEEVRYSLVFRSKERGDTHEFRLLRRFRFEDCRECWLKVSCKFSALSSRTSPLSYTDAASITFVRVVQQRRI